jgi:hypothetical protein
MKGLREFADPMCESLATVVAFGAQHDGAHAEDWDAGVAAINDDLPAVTFPEGTTGAKGRLLTRGDALHLIANARSPPRVLRTLYRWAIAAGAHGGVRAVLARFCVLGAVRRGLGQSRLRLPYIVATSPPPEIESWATAFGFTIQHVDGQATRGHRLGRTLSSPDARNLR